MRVRQVCVCGLISYKSTSPQLNALLKIKDLDLDKCSLVQNYSSFMHKGFYCLVFEYLEQTLSAFMLARSYQPLPLKSIRVIVQQVVMTLFRAVKAINAVRC